MFRKSKIRVRSIQTGDLEVVRTSVSLTKANILAMNGTPVTLVAAPGAGKALRFKSATLIYDFATAAYGGGGDVTIRYGGGGTTLSSTVSAANSFGAAADKITTMEALDTAAGIAVSANTALVITNATGAFTDAPSNGTGRVVLEYEVITTRL